MRDNHRRSTLITRRKATTPISCPTFTEVPSGSVISILSLVAAGSAPVAEDGSTCVPPLPFAGSLIVRTGRNTGGGSALSSPRLTWLRQFHSRRGLISYLRAISAMPLPGCSVSTPPLNPCDDLHPVGCLCSKRRSYKRRLDQSSARVGNAAVTGRIRHLYSRMCRFDRLQLTPARTDSPTRQFRRSKTPC